MSGVISVPALELDDVRVVTSDVWTSFLASHEPLEWSPAPLTEPEVMRAAVEIRGEWHGTVTLEMSSAAARTAARTMLTCDELDHEDVLDALGELVNMIGGNVKSLLPSGSTLGLPMVSSTPVRPSVPAGSTEHCRLDLSWAGTTIVVRVWSHATEKEDTPR
ncbi:MAG TPA: chemotaxis protein CheX [Marmoricola sp.]|nr:chemotaxis protein CheX [Marmoricola sp.]